MWSRKPIPVLILYFPLPSKLTETKILVSFVFLLIFAFLAIINLRLIFDIYIINYFINKSDIAIEEIKLISTYKAMNTAEKWHGTTIVLLRKGNETVVAGDGQVSLGNTVLKSKAKKVRKIESRGVIAGFAGSTADALTLFERLEAKLEKHAGNLQRAAVELAKDWRSDKFLRRLEALMAVADKKHSFIISGTGDVLEPEDGIIGIGSGGNYALAAAKVLIETDMKAEEIARKSIKVASDICVFTNNNITVEKV
jgi:ATP-dependent HslUV protease subunit HslV